MNSFILLHNDREQRRHRPRGLSALRRFPRYEAPYRVTEVLERLGWAAGEGAQESGLEPGKFPVWDSGHYRNATVADWDSVCRMGKNGERKRHPTAYYHREDSLAAVNAAVGAALAAGEMVMEREYRFAPKGSSAKHAFCLIRPPGHHATRDHAEHYCIVNNASILADYAMRKLGCRKVAIIDIDLHFGNGTADIWKDSDRVLFASIHSFHPVSLSPGLEWAEIYGGRITDSGVGAGEGFNVCIPLNPLKFRECLRVPENDYIFLLDSFLKPVVMEFNPDLLIVSAGFDTADVGLPEKSYRYIGQILKEVADRCCGGRIVSLYEGGYRCRERVPKALLYYASPWICNKTNSVPQITPTRAAESLRRKLVSHYSQYWSCLEPVRKSGRRPKGMRE